MEFPVEKSEFLNLYPDREPPPRKSVATVVEQPYDPLVTLGPCNICMKELTKEEILLLTLKCANFAAEKHSKQRRKDLDETPYINHPLGVANILTNEGEVFDPVVILAALLHDTVEDTDTTFEEIEREFGPTVSRVVREVTDDKDLPKAERKRLQIENAPKRSYEAKLVTLADKIYNLRDIQKSPPVGWTYMRVREYFQWAKQVVDGCRRTNLQLETALDVIFAKQSKDAKEKCSCMKTLAPACGDACGSANGGCGCKGTCNRSMDTADLPDSVSLSMESCEACVKEEHRD